MRDLAELTELPPLTGDGVVLRPLRADDAGRRRGDVRRRGRCPLDAPHAAPVHPRRRPGVGRRRGAKWREERWANFAAVHAATGDLVASCGLRLETQHARGEIGYLVHRDRRRRGVAAACVALLSRLGPDDLGLGARDPRRRAQRRLAAHGHRRRLPVEGVLRSAMTVGGERVDDVLFALVPGDPRPWHATPGAPAWLVATATAPAGLGWPRLTDGRLLVRPFEPDDAPAVQAACDDPDVAHWIHGLPTPYSLADAECVHRRRAAPAAARRARPARRHRRRFRRAARQRQPGPLRRPAGRRDRLLGQAGGAPPGRSPGGGAPRRRLGVRRARRRAPRAAHVPRQRGLAGPGGRLGFTRECLLRGFLAPEPGKSRRGAGRAVRGRQPPAPRRSGAVRAPASDPAPPA